MEGRTISTTECDTFLAIPSFGAYNQLEHKHSIVTKEKKKIQPKQTQSCNLKKVQL